MGPNSKAMSRKQYVKYRLRILKDLGIAPPSDDRIQEMMDETKMSEVAVDAVFLGCIERGGDDG